MLSSSKNGFALITALMVLLIIVSIVSLNFTSSGASKTITSLTYYKTQVHFYELSSKNIVAKKLDSYDFSNSCLEHLDLNFGEYLSSIDIFYIGKNLPCTSQYILDNHSGNDLNLTKIVNIKTTTTRENVSSFLRYTIF